MRNLLFSLVILCISPALSVAQQVQLPPGFVQDLVVDQLNPVSMTLDHHGRIWIAEKHGEVRIVNEAGQLLPAPFVSIQVDDYNERGLQGIALHPDFDNQPYVYLYYAIPGANRNRLSRFLANGDLAIPGSEEILMEFDQMAGTIHNGGAMAFGQNDMLFITTGEGADAEKASDLNSFHGKILRLHASGNIPPDNPFYNQLTGNLRAIYALGFRNPFAISYDLGNDRMFAGDVGGGEYEEVNLVEAGHNYGWPLIEGPRTFQPAPNQYSDPLVAYDHNVGCAITSLLYVPEGSTALPPGFHNSLIWGDYCQGFLRWRDRNGVEQVFATGIDRPLGMLIDEYNGWIYYLSRGGLGGGSEQDNTSTDEGTLWRLRYVGDGPPHISRQPQSVLVPFGEPVTFRVDAQGTGPLHFAWFVNGQMQPDTLPNFTIPVTALSMDGWQIQSVVTNSFGIDSSDVATLSVTANRRPRPEILLPDSTLLFRGGDTLSFLGRAFDPETGQLPDSALTWWVDLHHDLHKHPGAGPFVGSSSGAWVVPTVYETDPDVWFRVSLSAVDSAGLHGLKQIDLQPDLSMVFVDGPAGITVNLDGRTLTLPAQQPGMIGLLRTLQATRAQRVGDTLYLFDSWDNGSVELLRKEYLPETGLQVRLNYQTRVLGNGTGLTGSYFISPELDFASDPVLIRLDSTVDFLWGNGSPGPGLPNDYFTVRWDGFVEPVFSEEYRFTVRADDGIRLWVNDQLIIDQWVPQPPTEASASIVLQAQQRYAIRLEYMEIEGGAEVNMYWESPSNEREIIPKRQLYPLPVVVPGQVRGLVWADRDRNGQPGSTEPKLDGHLVSLWQAEELVTSVATDAEGRYLMEGLLPGEYRVKADFTGSNGWYAGGTGLDLAGFSAPFTVADGGDVIMNLGLFPETADDLRPLARVAVLPNPMEEDAVLIYRQRLDLPVQVQIRDVLGRLVWEANGPTGIGDKRVDLPTAELSVGFYLVEMRQGAEVRRLWIARQ